MKWQLHGRLKAHELPGLFGTDDNLILSMALVEVFEIFDIFVLDMFCNDRYGLFTSMSKLLCVLTFARWFS
jgi:hypothetical protein